MYNYIYIYANLYREKEIKFDKLIKLPKKLVEETNRKHIYV